MITVVIPYCERDMAQAKDLLLWIQELSGVKKLPNPCLLVADNKILPTDAAEVLRVAKAAFKSVKQVRLPYNIKLRQNGSSGWPLGANWMFYCTCIYIAMTETEPWLWLEPDCLPLKPGWLEKIEAEYAIAQKPFLGPVIETQNKSFRPQYLNGTSVYPANALRYFHDPLKDFLNGGGNAFDVAGSSQTVPNAHFSALIQHGYTDDKGINHWGTHPNEPLVFKTGRADGDGENVVTTAVIHRETVLFHPCKNGSLIELLRKRREQVKVAA